MVSAHKLQLVTRTESWATRTRTADACACVCDPHLSTSRVSDRARISDSAALCSSRLGDLSVCDTMSDCTASQFRCSAKQLLGVRSGAVWMGWTRRRNALAFWRTSASSRLAGLRPTMERSAVSDVPQRRDRVQLTRTPHALGTGQTSNAPSRPCTEKRLQSRHVAA
jgi:hypothetical protein